MRNINNIDRDFLADLFSTATYGSNWLDIRTLKSERHLDAGLTEEELENRCCEEKWADRLLAGGHIVCIDMYAKEDGEDRTDYVIDLKQIRDGIYKALEVCPRDVADFLEEEDDYYTCYNLMQVIMFGDIVYG